MKILLISGYKSFELGIFSNKHDAVKYIKKAIKNKILLFIDELEWIIISGQMGTELWAAEVVFEIQDDYPHLKLGIFTPYEDQEKKWNETNQEYYNEILIGADHVDSISRKPYESPLQLKAKNEFLVSKSDGCILFYDNEKEGSPKYLYDLANKKNELFNYPIEMITFDDLQVIAEETFENDDNNYREI
ncbi:DUF1273 domain-containing protein [Gottfriedia sp. NPDC056225]|uniref:DUF1273 domain-containing protein n=1 Tax=Gottfriedia sp. NPDC056225 TaxID=3345751 RepID=UPI0015590DF0|nr:DUF1273 domain-containing protein [Arthrobacter citreus]